ncbi:MAG: hypothetical protein JJV94_04795 [Sulfurospirillum sp.]|nr:hypothetical protein [Sulfurospirillum sp.]
MSLKNIKVMYNIDEIATNNSKYGYRFIYQQLLEDGVLKYIQIMGIKAIFN